MPSINDLPRPLDRPGRPPHAPQEVEQVTIGADELAWLRKLANNISSPNRNSIWSEGKVEWRQRCTAQHSGYRGSRGSTAGPGAGAGPRGPRVANKNA